MHDLAFLIFNVKSTEPNNFVKHFRKKSQSKPAELIAPVAWGEA